MLKLNLIGNCGRHACSNSCGNKRMFLEIVFRYAWIGLPEQGVQAECPQSLHICIIDPEMRFSPSQAHIRELLFASFKNLLTSNSFELGGCNVCSTIGSNTLGSIAWAS